MDSVFSENSVSVEADSSTGVAEVEEEYTQKGREIHRPFQIFFKAIEHNK